MNQRSSSRAERGTGRLASPLAGRGARRGEVGASASHIMTTFFVRWAVCFVPGKGEPGTQPCAATHAAQDAEPLSCVNGAHHQPLSSLLPLRLPCSVPCFPLITVTPSLAPRPLCGTHRLCAGVPFAAQGLPASNLGCRPGPPPCTHACMHAHTHACTQRYIPSQTNSVCPGCLLQI